MVVVVVVAVVAVAAVAVVVVVVVVVVAVSSLPTACIYCGRKKPKRAPRVVTPVLQSASFFSTSQLYVTYFIKHKTAAPMDAYGNNISSNIRKATPR